MRRIATHLAAVAATATAAVAVLAAPATAATPMTGDHPLRGAQPLLTTQAVKPHKWKTGGSSGVKGAAAHGTWTRVTKKGKTKVVLYVKVTDTTPKDKLKPALGITVPGQKEYFLFLNPGQTSGEATFTLTATSVKVREAVGTPKSSDYFQPARHGLAKGFLKLF